MFSRSPQLLQRSLIGRLLQGSTVRDHQMVQKVHENFELLFKRRGLTLTGLLLFWPRFLIADFLIILTELLERIWLLPAVR